jgi:flavin reductase (DIM6/NTAB) family NADH-FMN oxidoreductase RutF
MDVSIEQVINVSTHVIAVASIVAAIVPTPAAGPALIVARRLLDYVAFNFGGAKNQAQVEAEKFKR